MTEMAAMLVERGRGARSCEAFEENTEAGEKEQLERVTMGTPPGAWVGGIGSDATTGKLQVEGWKAIRALGRAAGCGRRNRPIRKNIIGHGMGVLGRRLAGRGVFLYWRGTFALLHQPARKHGCGIFLHPLVQKRSDLLAEIGSMAEAREFITLQRIARSREKELPRGLRLVVSHKGLQGQRPAHINMTLTLVNNYKWVMACG